MRPTILTINGFMGDMWQGPQADVGRYLSNLGLAYWQPVGYNSGAFPLGTGVQSGLAELRNQIDQHPGPLLFSSWSLGSIVAVEWYKQARAGGPQANRLADLKGAVTFGNPLRQAGKWAPRTGYGAVPDPTGAGIGGPRANLTDTPDWQHDYAHKGDLYTCADTGEVGEDLTLIYDFVVESWTGAYQDLWHFATEVIKGPLAEMWGILGAIIDAIGFYGGGTAQHVNYNATALGALNYMAGIARAI